MNNYASLKSLSVTQYIHREGWVYCKQCPRIFHKGEGTSSLECHELIINDLGYLNRISQGSQYYCNIELKSKWLFQHPCKSVLLPLSIWKLVLIPAGVLQNVTNKSYLVCLKSNEMNLGSPLDPLGYLGLGGQPQSLWTQNILLIKLLGNDKNRHFR